MPSSASPAALVLLIVATLAGPAPAAPADPSPQADFSGLERFWAVADLLAADREVPESAWQAMFATPGYRTLLERDQADRFFERLLPLAVSPARREEAAQTRAESPVIGMFIDHLSAAYERRVELRAFVDRLRERPLLDEALTAARVWLPAGSTKRFGPPSVSYVLYQPDARGYDRIVMDLLLAFEQPELMDGLLAHETHHVIRAGLQGPTSWKSLPEADLLFALDSLQAEGVADMINMRAMLAVEDWGDGTTGGAFTLMTDRLRQEAERVHGPLAELDEILAAYAADPGAAEALGARLRQALVMGGHPVGYHMAQTIVAAGGRERMVANVADPFEFMRAYHRAATREPSRHRALGIEALRGLELLEERASR